MQEHIPDWISVPPSIALTAAKTMGDGVDPEELNLPDDLDPKIKRAARKAYQERLQCARWARASSTHWNELLDEFATRGANEMSYAASIRDAMVAYDRRKRELKDDQQQAFQDIKDFEHNFTGGYVLGTLVALMAKPAFLMLQILGFWAIFGAYIPMLSGKTDAPEGTSSTLWVIIIQIGAAIAATIVAFIFRGILMKIRMSKLAKKKDQMTALANYRYYDGMLALTVRTAFHASRAYCALSREEQMPFNELRSFWDDVIDARNSRSEFAERAGVEITDATDIATAIGMSGEEDSIFEAFIDILTN